MIEYGVMRINKIHPVTKSETVRFKISRSLGLSVREGTLLNATITAALLIIIITEINGRNIAKKTLISPSDVIAVDPLLTKSEVSVEVLKAMVRQDRSYDAF